MIRGYCRSSVAPKNLRHRPAGGDSPLGVGSQEAAILARFPEAKIYVDAARSGRNARRPALRQMLADVLRGDIVAVVRLDRLARDFRLMMALELQIETVCGGRLVSLAGEGTSLTGPPDPVALFQRRIAAAAAELQAHQIAQSTAAAFKQKRADGYAVNGTARYGWHVVEGGKIEPDEQEQRVLNVMREFCRGRLDLAHGSGLARRLNELGLTNRKGRPWTAGNAVKTAQRAGERERAGNGLAAAK